jgi:hypothetical protein
MCTNRNYLFEHLVEALWPICWAGARTADAGLVTAEMGKPITPVEAQLYTPEYQQRMEELVELIGPTGRRKGKNDEIQTTRANIPHGIQPMLRDLAVWR